MAKLIIQAAESLYLKKVVKKVYTYNFFKLIWIKNK